MLDKLAGWVVINVEEQPTERLEHPSFYAGKDKVERMKPKKIKQDKYKITISGFNLLKKEIQERIVNEMRKQM